MKTTEKQSDKRKALMDASLKLFTEKCFQDTSTASISQAANVGTGTLFCYFNSKEELVNELYLELKEEFAAFTENGVWDQPTFKTQLKYIFDRRVQWHKNNPDKIKFMMQYSSSALITKVTREKALTRMRIVHEVVAKAVERGELTTVSVDLVGALISGYFHQASVYINENAKAADTKQWQEEAFNVLWKGLS